MFIMTLCPITSQRLCPHRLYSNSNDRFVSLMFRSPRVTVRHDYLGPRSYRVSPLTSVQDVKQLLFEETDLPVEEQQLTHNGKVVSCSYYSHYSLQCVLSARCVWLCQCMA